MDSLDEIEKYVEVFLNQLFSIIEKEQAGKRELYKEKKEGRRQTEQQNQKRQKTCRDIEKSGVCVSMRL